MKEGKLTELRFLALSLLLTFVYGCNGGGGVANLGSLLGGAAGAVGVVEDGISGGGAVITNPEPASMLLIGTGIAAMAYYRSKMRN